jgi:coenzyme PQQ synthesis protein D (PqqD)
VIRPPAWDDVVCAASREMSSPVCDEVALLGFDGEIYRDRDSIPARVWKLVRRSIRVSDIHKRIVEETGLDEEAVRKGVLDTLDQLRQAALIEVRNEESR